MVRAPRICCFDLDTFFVSVERLHDPSLVGRPIVVGAAPGHRGVVLSASYEVRPLGVRSGMAVSEAARLAPDAVFLEPRLDTYGAYAARVRQLLERVAPVVQTASIDEFYLDFHGCEGLFRRLEDRDDDAALVRVLHEARAWILRDIGLPASAGVGCTRAVAKIASGLAKPNRALAVDDGRHLGSGVVLVPAGTERACLGALPLRSFPGIGPVAERKLGELGLRTIDELLSLADGALVGELADLVFRLRSAFDGETPELGRDRPVFQEHDPQGSTLGSLSNESTFSVDLGDLEQVDQRLLALVERVCWRARKRRVRARTVTVKLRYRDFQTVQRSATRAATSEDREVLEIARELLAWAWSRPLAIRLLGVQLSNLVGPESQLELPFARQRHASPALDAVRERFGFGAIHRGGGLARR